MDIKKLMFLTLAVILLTSILPAFAVWHEPIAMWVEPDSISWDTATVSVGYKFNVTVWVNVGTQEVGAWQFKMIYDPSYLSFTGRAGLTGTGGMRSEFFEKSGTESWGLLLATGADYVQVAESWKSGPYATGNGSLAWVEFEVVGTPDKGETLNLKLDISSSYPDDTYLLDPDMNTIPMDVFDCTITYTWSPPPIPVLMVDPSSRFFDRYSHWTGVTFTEDIRFDDLDPAWYVTNVSCTITFDPSFLEVLSVTFDPIWNVETAYTIDNVAGTVDLFAETDQSISGDVIIATLEFNITAQGTYPEIYESYIDFASYSVFDHSINITDVYGTDVVPGYVTVEGYLAVHMPHLEVVPNEVVVGPEYVVGQEFTVSVDIKRLHFAWKLIGVQFRMTYCDDLLEVVQVEEGDFFKPFAPYGTFFCSYVEEDYYGPHILVGTMILPNASGYWDQFPPYPGAEWGEPGENGTIAEITFKIKKQLTAWPPVNLTCTFGLFDIIMIDVEGNDVPYDTPVNGTYTCISNPAREVHIDVYGGAVNRGYGSIPFPAPYGGQGINATMDMVAAQSEVTLFAIVTYNYYPEAYKVVAFEIIDPYGKTWAKLTAQTNESGIATITFRMPWTWSNATKYFGEWTVVASTEVADVKVFDYLWFKYDYLVNIWNVATDKYYYEHYETVTITIDYGTYAEQAIYPGVITATILDETGQPIGYAETTVTIGGATYCSYYNLTETLTIYIPEWARAGYAYIHVNIFDKDPAEGGSPWCPEYVTEIYILPEP